MSALNLKIDNARAMARGLHCEGLIIIAVDRIAEGKRPFWYGKAVSFGSTGAKGERMGAFMDWLLKRSVHYACPKCGVVLDPARDIIKADRPTGKCPECGFGGYLMKFDIADF